jgi:hypothetical protein
MAETSGRALGGEAGIGPAFTPAGGDEGIAAMNHLRFDVGLGTYAVNAHVAINVRCVRRMI